MKLEVGDDIKIVRNAERFWCIIKSIANNSIIVEINNHVRCQPPNQQCGDLLTIHESDIVAIYLGDHKIGI
jgi:16S rRNA U1498 N3-methylase RsmE